MIIIKNKIKILLLFFVFYFLSQILNAQIQRQAIEFGDIKTTDFKATYSIDTAANALYLFNGGYTQLVQKNGFYFAEKYTKHTRIRILKQTAFKDLSTVHISLINSKSRDENLTNFKAAIYNLENGIVRETDFDKKDLISDRLIKTHDGNLTDYKFTFPQLKEGSIIEYTYSADYSENLYLPEWHFQLQYPCLWSEYETTLPYYYTYIATLRGDLKYDFQSNTTFYSSYNIGQYNDSANTINKVWAMQNIRALTNEPFTANINNFASSLSFHLYSINHLDYMQDVLSSTWRNKAYNLMKDEDFGLEFEFITPYLKDVLKNLNAISTGALDKVKKTYQYTRDNYTCDDEEGIYLSQPLKDVFTSKKGSIADINLLLTELLIKEGFDAKPVILSTRNNGIAAQAYPEMDMFNYVICLVNINGQKTFLDASNKFLAFSHLTEQCYNGTARIIDTAATPISFSADSLKESSMTTVYLSNGDKGLEGNVSYNPGYIKSYQLRNELSNEKQEDFFKDIKKKFDLPVDISNTSINTLSDLENPVNIKYDVKVDPGNDDIIYFNPILLNALKENPFQAEQRAYPVEMPYCQDNIYVLNMETPKGYVIDELPKSTRVMLNESDGMFEYLIGKTDNGFQMRCRLKLNKANFEPSDYQNLRDFYSFILKQENEQVVFKKIK